MRVLELREGERNVIHPNELTDALALEIKSTRHIDVEFPNPLNERRYVLRPQNVVGLVPIGRELMLRIAPKLRIANLFGMLEEVHELTSFRVYDGIGRVEAIEDIYERLARMFARAVLARVRRGLDSDYVCIEEDSSFIRGRIDVARSTTLQLRGSTRLHCAYEERTIDIPNNRILLWALDRIPRLGLNDGGVLNDVRMARRAMSGAVQLQEMKPRDCVGLRYNRLNADYAMLHALARFFLERMGPGVESGAHEFIPFTVNVSNLFQEYLVACLRQAAPPGIAVRDQFRAKLEGDVEFDYKMDAVIVELASQRVLMVIEAKYKLDEKPSREDMNQVIAYATHVGAPCGLLIYPTRMDYRRKTMVGPANQLCVETIGFDVGQDLSVASCAFTTEIFGRVRQMLEAQQATALS